MKGAARGLGNLFVAPRRFFAARAEEPGGNVEATTFAFACQIAACIVDWTWYRLGWSLQGKQLSAFETLPRYMLAQMALFALLLPLEALAVQLLLRSLGSARVGFGATYRVCAYTQACVVLNIIPFVGWVLGGVGTVALLIIGIREVHTTSIGSAVFVATVGLFRLVVLALLAILGVMTLLHYR